jgi:hypothetical protein
VTDPGTANEAVAGFGGDTFPIADAHTPHGVDNVDGGHVVIRGGHTGGGTLAGGGHEGFGGSVSISSGGSFRHATAVAGGSIYARINVGARTADPSKRGRFAVTAFGVDMDAELTTPVLWPAATETTLLSASLWGLSGAARELALASFDCDADAHTKFDVAAGAAAQCGSVTITAGTASGAATGVGSRGGDVTIAAGGVSGGNGAVESGVLTLKAGATIGLAVDSGGVIARQFRISVVGTAQFALLPAPATGASMAALALAADVELDVSAVADGFAVLVLCTLAALADCVVTCTVPCASGALTLDQGRLATLLVYGGSLYVS